MGKDACTKPSGINLNKKAALEPTDRAIALRSFALELRSVMPDAESGPLNLQYPSRFGSSIVTMDVGNELE